MLVQNLLVAFAVSALGLAQDVDNNDVPLQCRGVCSPVIALSKTCDAQFDNSDRGYLNCVCSAAGANVVVPVCEACVAQFDSDRRDNDVNDIIRSCSFTTTTYNPAATYASASLVTGTRSSHSISVATTGGIIPNATRSPITPPAPSQPTGTATQQSPGAAAALGAPAGAALGVIGVMLGLM